MRSEPLAVYSVIHPAALPYVGEWYASVLAQTDLDFEMWVSLDGVSLAQASELLRPARRITWLTNVPGVTPAGVRDRAMALLVERYSRLVVVDSDDVLAPDRVAAARAALDDHDMVGCALHLMDQQGGDLGGVFGPPPGVDPVAALPDWNVFGLSNTAWRCARLRECLPLGADCAVPDWTLATRAWLTGADIAFDRTPHMWYRQHPENVVRVLAPFTAADVRAATRRVRAHHAGLFAASPTGCDQAVVRLRHACQRVNAFGDWLDTEPDAASRYVAELNRLPSRRVWWWGVANPHLEELWTH
jgi:hypothetical protein